MLATARSKFSIKMFLMIYLILGWTVQATIASEKNIADDKKAFKAAIDDVIVPQDVNVYNELIPITKDSDCKIKNDKCITWRDSNKQQLLVVIWMSEDNYKKYYYEHYYKGGCIGGTPNECAYKTPVNEHVRIWVTTVPEVKKFCQDLKFSEPHLSDRLKQYLGIDPTKQYQQFVELWVRAEDLFRPCPDPEIDDTQCDLTFKGNPIVKGISNYKTFFVDLFKSSYGENGAPWTRLGYTYDWGGETKIGASEFMIKPGSSYEVESVYSTEDYCKR